MKLTIRISFLTLLTVSIVGASWSVRHFGLAKSIPDAGSSVQSPEQLQLWFTQAPQDESVTIRLIDAAGDLVQTGEPVRHAEDAKLMEVQVITMLGVALASFGWRTHQNGATQPVAFSSARPGSANVDLSENVMPGRSSPRDTSLWPGWPVMMVGVAGTRCNWRGAMSHFASTMVGHS